jgi:CRISPR-associated endonuclease/helicase Cas3
MSFEQAFGFAPHPLQREFINAVDGPGVYVLEAPMGSGKTEAALYAAYRLMVTGVNAGLYFGLPTRLTSDKIHERVRRFLDKVAEDAASVRLAHGHAWLRAFEFGGEQLAPGHEWFNPRKRALLVPFAVGTIDQALLSVIKVRHFFVRRFGLAGKVVVLDEVHSYDLYTGTLLDLLVRTLMSMNCTVIVLSATLTRARKTALLGGLDVSGLDGEADEYPQVSVRTATDTRRASLSPPAETGVVVDWRDATPSDVANQAVAKALAGQCVLCIANTVATAQQWYNEVKAATPEMAYDVGLLHSKFPSWRRAELEAQWTTTLGRGGPRPKGCVLVATQVVEQSVDLDADFLITELAPTDMLFQRLGRLWRHSRPERPATDAAVLIVTRDLDSVGSFAELVAALGKPNSRVYAPFVLWRTFQVWKSVSSLRLPADIRPLLEQTYSEPSRTDPAFVHEARQNVLVHAEKLRALANAARADVLGFPTMEDDDEAVTRYSDIPTVDVVLARSVDSTGREADVVLSDGSHVHLETHLWIPSLAVALHRNLVPIPTYRLIGSRRPVFLSKYFHDSRTPLLEIRGNGELSLDGRSTRLRYDHERGVLVASAASGWPQPFADVDYEGGFDELD